MFKKFPYVVVLVYSEAEMEGTCNLCVFPVQNPPKHPGYYSGSTPLMLAACRGYVQCLKDLIKAGVDVNLANDYGSTPLMWDAAGKQITCLQELIKSGAEVNKADSKGHTTLMYAAFFGFEACLPTLFSAGIDQIRRRSEQGR